MFTKISSSIFPVLFLLVLPVCASGIEISDDVKTDQIISLLDKTNLRINARIYYGANDEEAIPVRTQFFLLDKSVVEILKSENFSFGSKSETGDESQSNDAKTINDEEYLEALATLLTDQEDEEGDLLKFLFWEAIKKSTVAQFETDYFGGGKSARIKSGNYYLFAYQPVEDEIFIWDYPVYLSGAKEIEMDQNTAAAIIKILSKAYNR